MYAIPLPGGEVLKTKNHQSQQNEQGEVDYSLLENYLALSTTRPTGSTIELLAELCGSPDVYIKSLGLYYLPIVLRQGLNEHCLDDIEMDRAREIWKDQMLEDDGYEAQELFYLEQGKLKKNDVSTYQWLKDHIVIEWFD